MSVSPYSGTLSVVIPVFNGASSLADCLHAVFRSAHQPLEVIVADDGSTDASPRIARQFGVKLLETGERKGPAAARTLAAEHARGEIVVFVDADVILQEDTLGAFSSLFAADPDLAAAFGSYDDQPAATNFVSQWKNLSHHWFHQQARPEAQTFWAGCGAVRRSIFLGMGGFDTRYRGATIEDIEFGYRLRNAGYRILLQARSQATHAKRWTAWSAWTTDLFHRAIPWVRLILRSRQLPNSLNTSFSQRFSVLLAALFVLSLITAVVLCPPAFLAALALFVCFLLSRYWSEPWSLHPSWLGWLRSVAINMAAVTASIASGNLLFAIAFAGHLLLMPFCRARFRPQASTSCDFAYGLCLAPAFMGFAREAPAHPAAWCVLAIPVLVLALNSRYFGFLVQSRGLAFSLAALPFQMGHYLAGAIGLVVGALLSLRDRWRNFPARS